MATINSANTQVTAYSTGEMIYTLQPSFGAQFSTNRAAVTGDGTVYVPQYDTESWDINSDYNNTTFIFTAPVTGTYYFSAGVFGTILGVSHTEGIFRFVATGGTYLVNNWNTGNIATATFQQFMGGRLIINMTASDTIYCEYVVSNGTKVVQVNSGSGGLVVSWFTGFLMG